MKKYFAKTEISICVILKNGKSVRVSFSPLTDGGSVYYTSDEEIQWALEHHHKFGKMFAIDDEFVMTKPKVNQRKKLNQRVTMPATSPKLNIIESTHSVPMLNEAEKVNESAPGQSDIEASETDSVSEDEEASDESSDDIGPTEDADADLIEEDTDEYPESGLTKVEVSDLGAAKDYLAERFEVQRTKLKTKKAIDEVAATYGVIFNYAS